MIIAISLFIALGGLLLYAFAPNDKLATIGKIVFAIGFGVFVFRLDPQTISFLR